MSQTANTNHVALSTRDHVAIDGWQLGLTEDYTGPRFLVEVERGATASRSHHEKAVSAFGEVCVTTEGEKSFKFLHLHTSGRYGLASG